MRFALLVVALLAFIRGTPAPSTTTATTHTSTPTPTPSPLYLVQATYVGTTSCGSLPLSYVVDATNQGTCSTLAPCSVVGANSYNQQCMSTFPRPQTPAVLIMSGSTGYTGSGVGSEGLATNVDYIVPALGGCAPAYYFDNIIVFSFQAFCNQQQNTISGSLYVGTAYCNSTSLSLDGPNPHTLTLSGATYTLTCFYYGSSDAPPLAFIPWLAVLASLVAAVVLSFLFSV